MALASEVLVATTDSVVIDETSGTQNDASGEAANNDFDISGGTGALPAEFDAALTVVAGGQGNPSGAALSGFSTATPTGVDVFSFGDGVTDVGFTDAVGDALDGTDSGLVTADGTKVFLYTYAGDNNVLLALKGDDNGTPGDPSDDTADPSGLLVFAAYLDTGTVALGSDAGATGAKVWVVQYEALFHPDATDPDDAVSPADVIYVTVGQLTTFSLEGAPSGQNLFLMYGDADVALVVTGRDPSTTGHVTDGDTVNTGQGGGGTTIGSNNQMLDPGEGLYFTFVTGADPEYTVPNLDQNEADVEGNILFDDVFGSMGASFKVVQTQPASKAGTLQLTASTTAAEPGLGYIAGLDGDSPVAITSVVVKNALGVVIETDGDADNDNLTITIDGGVATIEGVKAGYTIEYVTAAEHNRVLIENIGNDLPKFNADFDIGDFALPSTTTSSVLFDVLAFEDDGPSAAGAAVTSEVDEDGLPAGNPGGPGDLDADDGINDDNDGDEATASGSIAGIFSGGADGLASFGLSSDPADIALLPALSSKGGTVAYDVSGDTLTAYVDDGTTAGYQAAEDREVFSFAITDTSTGAFSFSLLDQLDHDSLDGLAGDDTENELELQLGAILQATDLDGDTVTAAADKLVITVDDDTPLALAPADITVHNAAAAYASAALGYYGKVGADEDGTVKFVGGTDGDILQGVLDDGSPTLEDLLFGGLPIKLYGFGTDTLTATTDINDSNATVFVMTLNPDGSVEANDLYDITMYKTIANTQDVEFGAFTAHVASGNPLTLVVYDIGGTEVDALFSGWLDTGDNITTTPPGSSSQTTVNVSQAGVGVGTGQDFNFEPQTSSASDDLTDRIRIEFLEDDGDGVLEAGEALTINRFTFVMNQNNSPADDGDALVRVYDAAGNEVQITGILVNGEVLVGAGGGPVDSNDGGTVSAVASGLGYELHGLGGGTAGSDADNDTVTIITASGYTRIDISGIGNDANKDTFDILLKSIAVPVSYDLSFSVEAQLTDEDGDSSAAASLDVTLDADGVFLTTLGVASAAEPTL